jgi:antibiotic biosynthesis monooxygenase (ABM) superfamily enzyme
LNAATPDESHARRAPGASVTFVVQHRVRADAFDRYEEWLKRIVAVCSTYPGYQGVHIIRPVAGDNEYSTIVRFATFADAERWCKSADRPRLIAEIGDILEREDQARIETGIDFWFTPAQGKHPQARPWKQWLVTTSVIWPLTVVIPMLFEPLFQAVPWLGAPGLREGLVVAVTVALVVFVIMPRYVRAIASWLYSSR